MPSSKHLLIAFVASCGAQKVSSITIKHWLLGLELWHIVNGAPWLSASVLKHIVKASLSLAPKSSFHTRCSPVLITHLSSLHHHLDFTNLFNVTVFAITCVSFWGQARLGEVTFNGSFDPLLHATKSGLILAHTSTSHAYGKLWIPCTKMKPQGDYLMFTDSGCPCRAITALHAHFDMNSSISLSAPVFAFKTLNNLFSLMKCSWFLTHCNKIWLQDGLNSLLGHAFRIGRTTHLLLLGVDPFIMMIQGHWSSNAFLSYWCFCKEIIPLFVGFSLDSKTSILTSHHVIIYSCLHNSRHETFHFEKK